MSDFSFGLDDEFFSNTEESQKEKEKRSDAVTRIVKIIVGILIFVLIFEILFYKFIIPSNDSPRVNISGNVSYSTEEIAEYLRSMNCNSFYTFNIDSALLILCSVPGIKNVNIKKVFPDKIYIEIEERTPVCVTFVNSDGRSKALQIDDEGFLFPEKLKIDETKVPIISGLPVEYLTEGMRIPEEYRVLINQIKNLSENKENYFQFISEICVLPKEYGNFELILIPVNSKIKVFADRSLNEDKFKYMIIALDIAKSLAEPVSVVDLRYGSVSFK